MQNKDLETIQETGIAIKVVGRTGMTSSGRVEFGANIRQFPANFVKLATVLADEFGERHGRNVVRNVNFEQAKNTCYCRRLSEIYERITKTEKFNSEFFEFLKGVQQ